MVGEAFAMPKFGTGKPKPDALEDLSNHLPDDMVGAVRYSMHAAAAHVGVGLGLDMAAQTNVAHIPQSQQVSSANMQSITQAISAMGVGPSGPFAFDPGITKAEPLARKLQSDFDKLSDALPYSVVLRIKSIEARYRDKDKRAVDMVVFFDTGKEMVLPASNTFPTDADISRIIIECP